MSRPLGSNGTAEGDVRGLGFRILRRALMGSSQCRYRSTVAAVPSLPTILRRGRFRHQSSPRYPVALKSGRGSGRAPGLAGARGGGGRVGGIFTHANIYIRGSVARSRALRRCILSEVLQGSENARFLIYRNISRKIPDIDPCQCRRRRNMEVSGRRPTPPEGAPGAGWRLGAAGACPRARGSPGPAPSVCQRTRRARLPLRIGRREPGAVRTPFRAGPRGRRIPRQADREVSWTVLWNVSSERCWRGTARTGPG